MNAAAFLLADGRFPAGGHAHSGGLEAAASAGTVHDLVTLELFLRGRLRTTGLVTAALAAAALAAARANGRPSAWAELDAEADARTPSPAQRETSRRQGRALLRAARVAWPQASQLRELGCAGQPPHHAIALGATAAAAGCTGHDAARIAAYQSVTGTASAAVRLLSLDPLQVSGLLARLADEIDAVAERASSSPELPCAAAPVLDLLAETHARAEVRLFAS
ncbi:MAG TPA: urease accessory UreF family protein [Streptosporangiaceae bacterium]|nr:urease accessory UreF family protein [Streptosporangiaceae bacterium]